MIHIHLAVKRAPSSVIHYVRVYILFIFVHMQNAFQCSCSLLVTRCLKEDLKHVSKFLLVPCSSKVNVHAIVLDSFFSSLA